MKVLVAARRGSSGIRTYTDHLVAGLVERGHEVVLLDETKTGSEPHAEQSRTDAAKVVPVGPPTGPYSRFSPVRGWGRRADVARRAHEEAVDVVHVTHLDLAPRHPRVVVTAWDPIASPIARWRVATRRGERPLHEAGFGVVDAVAMRRAKTIVAVTRDVADAVRVFRRPVAVIPPFLPDSEVRSDRRRTANVVMIANGIDGPRKGLDLAVEAVAIARRKHPGLQLDLIGRWSEPEAQGGLPAFCRVLGPVDRAELLQRLPGYLCAVVPSLWEEFGYAGLEALATGVPIATGPLPAYADLSGGGVFRAGVRTPQALAEQIERAMAVDGFEFPRECLSSVAVPKLVELYGRLR